MENETEKGEILSVVQERRGEEARAEGKRDAKINTKGDGESRGGVDGKKESGEAGGKSVCEDCQ